MIIFHYFSSLTERTAIWYLTRRGLNVLPRDWIGMAVGGQAKAICDMRNALGSVWTVSLMPGADLIAINYSMMIAMDRPTITVSSDSVVATG